MQPRHAAPVTSAKCPTARRRAAAWHETFPNAPFRAAARRKFLPTTATDDRWGPTTTNGHDRRTMTMPRTREATADPPRTERLLTKAEAAEALNVTLRFVN